MPTLQFKGKNAIWNHHLSVPYHTLESETSLDFQPEKGSGNFIVEGDNLLALKALLPQYAGKIKCIYIDPPYNTGNENWVYNDNVNSPLIQEWLGKEVGRDDLTRHDKWLCMMVPRLKLLRELLSDDGVIFVSIDDEEQHNLRLIIDEIFGLDNFISNIIWQKKFSPQNDASYFSDNHDFIICYAKRKKSKGENINGWERNLLPRTDNNNQSYSNPDNDPRGDWTPSDFTVKSYSKEYDYSITTPGGRQVEPTKGRCWQTSKENYQKLVEDNRIWFGADGNNVPRIKTFLSEVKDGIVPLTIWLNQDVGHNQQAKQELKELFEGNNGFDSPKPVSLINRILLIATSPDSIILDSFAGSGTTMHAVMELNQEDGGNRQCILVQMAEASEKEPDKNICKDITRERIKRAIEKNNYDSGFSYLRVGRSIDSESILNGDLPDYKTFAKYVYFLCTGSQLANAKDIKEKDWFVGKAPGMSIYLQYKDNLDELMKLALTMETAENWKKAHPQERIIVYSPACFLEEDYLRDSRIEFVSIPYGLYTKTRDEV